ncbi:MAG: alanine racemase [Alphaproteobacteria bacterium]|nr:alanine racemase [Alphaproteobacteria bacterium]
MRLSDLPTPCLVLDRGRLEHNLAVMSQAVRRHGVALRPHLKTAKSAEIGRMAVAGEAGGVTVSTLAEARYFAANGFKDILYAVGIVPAKLAEVARLMAGGAVVHIITDDPATARAIAAQGVALGVSFSVLVEIDCGEARGGIPAGSPALLDIARMLAAPGATLSGIMTHAGHSYACRDLAAVQAVAEAERVAAVTAAERLRAEGFACPIVSAGSTPTALHGTNWQGVTELRAGVYMFGDLFQAEIGSNALEDIALSVLSSVIGRRAEENRFLIDAGALALSKDRSTEATPHDRGFGLVRDLLGRPAYGEAKVLRANQEHGIVAAAGPLDFAGLPIGARVRVLPNHACLTAAAYDRYHVVDGGDEIVAVWERVNGW